MPPTKARDLYVAYGGLEIGGNTDNLPTDFHQVRKSFDTSSFEVSFVVTGTTYSQFSAKCANVEAEGRKPYKNLLVRLKGATILSLSHTASTGFNAQPELAKEGDDADTGWSRHYTLRIEFEMPADVGTTTGLRESSIEVNYLPTRRAIVTISGIWTAIGSTSARDHYDSNCPTYCTTILTALGGTYPVTPTEETASSDNENKLMSFSRKYQELIFGETADSPLDDTEVGDSVLTISRRVVSPGDYPAGAIGSAAQSKHLIILDVRFELKVDKTQTTDLRTKWANTKAWVISQVEDTLDDGTVALVDEKPQYDYSANTITVELVCLGLSTGGMIENRVTVADSLQSGRERVGLWTGNPYSRHIYQGPATLRRTITQTIQVVGIKTPAQVDALGIGVNSIGPPNRNPIGGSGSWNFESRNAEATPQQIGDDEYSFDVTDGVIVTVWEYAATEKGRGSVEGGFTTGPGGRQVAITQ